MTQYEREFILYLITLTHFECVILFLVCAFCCNEEVINTFGDLQNNAFTFEFYSQPFIRVRISFVTYDLVSCEINYYHLVIYKLH